jgi:hypothetical protein
MTKLAPTTQRAFDSWIKHDAWYTGHDNDLARFHAFVWAVIRYSRRPPSESDIRELIAQHWKGFDDYALAASNLYKSLYDFGKARNAPGVASSEVERYIFETQTRNTG